MISDRNVRRLAKKQAKKYPIGLREVPRADWPGKMPDGLNRVFRSQDYLVQEFLEADGTIRLSVSCALVTGNPAGNARWNEDGLSWDELMAVKQQCGYGTSWAVEIYPEADLVVNVANMRHLWIMPFHRTIGWKQVVIGDPKPPGPRLTLRSGILGEL